ncbi:BlaI/MecI/CopY family transcriptional regulator [Balneolales bacterium ANBcel1]|nr:BlaI/MecI/CopY family transcriptional regulator [Balneolales bacterium ANBcel1]
MKRSLTPLGETEMEVLQHVWDLGEATGNDVRKRIHQTRDLAYTTIITVLKNLVQKGYLKYRKEGVTHVYSAAREPESVRYNLVNHLVEKVFRGSRADLIQTLVEKEKLTAEQLKEIRRMIDQLDEQ